MTAKELLVGSALVLGAAFTAAVDTSSGALAQGHYGYRHHWHGPRYREPYNYSGYGPISPPDCGRDMGVEAVR